MPATCVNCGEQDFDLIDGHFYCTQCQTQTQDLLEEQEDDYVQQYIPASLEIRARPTKEAAQRAELYRGRPWRIHEGFGVILREQVQALIRLGANPLLEDVAWRVWVLYLSKLKLAFCEDEDSREDAEKASRTYETRSRMRDKFQGTVSDPRPKTMMRNNATYKKSYGMLPHSRKRRRLEQQKKEFAASMQSHDFYEGDNPAEEEDKQSALDRDLLILAEAELDKSLWDDGKKESRPNRVTGYHDQTVYRLNKIWVLSVAYLALQYTNNLLMPADMWKLVQSGEVPYFQAEGLFPDDMKLAGLDQSVFFARECNADMLRKKTGVLAQLLGLKDLPAPALEILTSRYITELNLPSEMHSLVHELVKLLPVDEILPRLSHLANGLHHYSAVAMGYIVIVLKLVFGLDDKSEEELSNYGHELAKSVDCPQPLFIWQEWVAATEERLAAMKTSLTSATAEEDESQPTAGPAAMNSSQYVRPVRRYSVRAETRQSLGKPFHMLLSKVSHPQQPVQNDTSDEDEAVTDRPTFRTASWPASDPELGPGSPLQSKDFSQCTLRYITEETYFVEELLKSRLSMPHQHLHEEVIPLNEDEEPESEEEIPDKNHAVQHPDFYGEGPGEGYPPATYGSHLPETRKLLSAVLAKCFHREQAAHESDGDVLVEDDAVNFPRACTNYISHPFSAHSAGARKYAMYRSYAWLIGVCAKHIETTENLLKYTIRKMECILFPEISYCVVRRRQQLRWLECKAAKVQCDINI